MHATVTASAPAAAFTNNSAPIFVGLLAEQDPASEVWRVFGRDVLEPSAVLDPGTSPRRVRRAIEGQQSPTTATIVLGGGGRW